MRGKRIPILLLAVFLTAFQFAGCGGADKTDTESSPQTVDNVAGTQAAGGLSSELKVSFLDVGLGDSIFLVLPDGETMLIDAGDTSAAETVIEYIKNAGYGRIDYLIATHPHYDHIGGMADILNTFDIGAVYMPETGYLSEQYANLLDQIKEKGYSIKMAKAGVNILKDGNLSVDILAPVKGPSKDPNNDSAVVKVAYGKTSFLFMGDALKQSEQQITADVDADVMKVGHHGSDYASDPSFIKRVSPSYAVISVGSNAYGFPSGTTLETLTDSGAVVYRTDQDGSVVIRSDGAKITAD